METKLRRFLIDKFSERYFGYVSPSIEFSIRETLSKAENDREFEAKMLKTVEEMKEGKLSQRINARMKTLGLK
jgi:hypothetical protein